MSRSAWHGAGGPEDWDRHASLYSRQLWLERASVRTALALLGARGDERVLDAGTGTGEVLRQLGRVHARPRAVTAVDFSVGMLASLPPLPCGWCAQLCDLRALPHASGSFDAVIASYVLHLLASCDLPVVLDELRRVLRPGGRLVTVTPALPPRGPGRALAAVLERAARSAPARLGGLHALDPRAALSAAGFTLAAARWSLRGYPSLCVLGTLR